MQFKELEFLVKTFTQDSQSKLPTRFSDWKMIIDRSAKKISLRTEAPLTVRVEDEVELTGATEADIGIEDDLSMAVAYDLAQLFSDDTVMKQKNITDYNTEIDNYTWDKYKKEALESTSDEL